MSLIALQDKEKAADLLTRLQELGVEIETGRNRSTSIAYAAHGLVLRQEENVVTTEYVGLTKAAAHLLENLDDDQTTSTIYYKAISESGEHAAVAITTGKKTDYVPTRSDADDCWKVTKTETTYAAASATGWSTSRPSVATNGITISEYAEKQFVAIDAFGNQHFQNISTVVKEYPFLTYTEAHNKVAAEKASGSRVFDIQVVTSWSTTGGVQATKNVTIRGGGSGPKSEGTDKVPTMRFDGPERGWVVTVTETTYWGSSS